MTDERGGRYFREARFFLAGDKVAAQSHILEARSLMGYMRDMHSLGGPPIQVEYVTLQDGTRIKATMMNGQYQAEIVSPYLAHSAVAKFCASFKSGLFAVESVGKYSRTLGSGVVEEYGAAHWLYTSEYERLVRPEVGAKIAVEEFADPDFIRVTGGDYFMPATYSRIFSTSYSGSMRQAVQLLLGMGKELVLDYSGGIVTPVYNYGFYGTHGLVKKAGYTDSDPAFWLVRMPADGYGVLAMTYPVCNLVTEEQITAGVMWIPSDVTVFPSNLDEAIADGTVTEILSKEAFYAAIEGYMPMYTDCGWAFSLSGHECQNVVYTVEELTPLDYRVYTRRIKVMFAVSDIAGKAAISCEIEQMEPAVFKGGRNSVPRFPWMLPSVWSLYPTYDAYAAPTPSLDTLSVNCPVHVFYSGDDAQVFNFVVHDPSEGTGQTGPYYDIRPYIGSRVIAAGTYTGTDNVADDVAPHYTLNGEAINTYILYGSGSESSYTLTLTGGAPAQYAITGGDSTANTPWIVTDLALGAARATHISHRLYNSRRNATVMLVPFHQREGVYVLDSESVNKNSITYTPDTFRAYVGSGSWWELYLTYSGEECASGNVHLLRANQDPTTVNMAPGAPVYSRTIASGLSLEALEGCAPRTPLPEWPPNPPDVVLPAETVWTGVLRFIGSDARVNVPLGTSSAPLEDNLVYKKIHNIMDTTYIDYGNSMYIHAWTDGIKADKYIVCTDVNTVQGSDTVTNTIYPLSDINTWGKSFVGIAN